MTKWIGSCIMAATAVSLSSCGGGYLWVSGYYNWDGSQYQWVPGTWAKAPRARAVWVPAHWQATSSGYVWVPGSWQ